MSASDLFEYLERDWRPWIVRLTCCGRDDGTYPALTWEEADGFRDDYLNASGHDRSAIIVAGPKERR